MSYTYNTLARLWATRRAGASDTPLRQLNHNARLRHDEAAGCYVVRLHNTDIVRVFPDHYVLAANGWDTRVTCRVISDVCGAWVYTHTSKFVTRLRVNGYPFFDGIRVDCSGIVFKEDIRPDYIRREDKTLQREYTRLHRLLEKQIIPRAELGEFAGGYTTFNFSLHSYLRSLELVAQGAFIPHETAAPLIQFAITTDFRDRLQELRKTARAQWFTARNGYYMEEVPNV